MQIHGVTDSAQKSARALRRVRAAQAPCICVVGSRCARGAGGEMRHDYIPSCAVARVMRADLFGARREESHAPTRRGARQKQVRSSRCSVQAERVQCARQEALMR